MTAKTLHRFLMVLSRPAGPDTGEYGLYPVPIVGHTIAGYAHVEASGRAIYAADGWYGDEAADVTVSIEAFGFSLDEEQVAAVVRGISRRERSPITVASSQVGEHADLPNAFERYESTFSCHVTTPAAQRLQW